MRDFRDAKAMAHALRDALKVKAVETTHSECLELIAKAFGYDNWNILAAKIDAAAPARSAERAHSSAPAEPAEPAEPPTLYCSFCSKSQHDVRQLIAGPGVYICDECVVLCTDFVEDPDDEDLLRLLQGDAEAARAMSTEELAHYVERGRKGVERSRLILQCIERTLAVRDGEMPGHDDVLALSRFAYLKHMTPEGLVALKQKAQHQLKRYEDGLRASSTALGARRP
jgi:hypothetical protein